MTLNNRLPLMVILWLTLSTLIGGILWIRAFFSFKIDLFIFKLHCKNCVKKFEKEFKKLKSPESQLSLAV